MALVRLTGLEPASHSTPDPKSGAFAISPQAQIDGQLFEMPSSIATRLTST